MTMLWMTMSRPHMQSRRCRKRDREDMPCSDLQIEGLDAGLLQKLQVIDGESHR